MKRFLMILLALMCVLAFAACSSEAETTETVSQPPEKTTSEGLIFQFSEEDCYYTLIGIGDCQDTDIIIPGQIDGVAVRVISEYAFANSQGITSVEIPNTVVYIGDEAFSGCRSLRSVTIPNSVKSISDGAFMNCTSLTSIVIPNSVAQIGSAAFKGCTELEEITVPFVGRQLNGSGSYGSASYELFAYIFGEVPESLKKVVVTGGSKIADSAFSGCDNLESITLPAGVTEIGNNAFSGCIRLADITLPDTLTDISATAFQGTAYYNNTANWENGVLYIGNYLIDANEVTLSGAYSIKEGTKALANMAFAGCTELTGVTIPSSITEIPYGFFVGCEKLESVVMPEGITKIGEGAFAGCTSLESFTIPAKVTKLERGLFYGCSSLKEIVIPDTVTSIGEDVLSGCSNLESITLPFIGASLNGEANNFGYIFGTSDSYGNATHVPTTLKNVTITGGQAIGSYAFYNCSHIESITLPTSLIKIADRAFSGCTALAKINYAGTKAQWNAIKLVDDWNDATGSYEIVCTDGKLPKTIVE